MWLLTALGGCVIGIFLASIGSAFYRLAAYEAAIFNTKLHELQKRRLAAALEKEQALAATPQHSHNGG